jgi:hypothetical protein
MRLPNKVASGSSAGAQLEALELEAGARTSIGQCGVVRSSPTKKEISVSVQPNFLITIGAREKMGARVE